MTQVGVQGKSCLFQDRCQDVKVVDHDPPGASVKRIVRQYQRDSVIRGNISASARVTVPILRRSLLSWLSEKPRARKLSFISAALVARSSSFEQIRRSRRNWL